MAFQILLAILLFVPELYSISTEQCDDYEYFNLEKLKCTRCKMCRPFEVLFSECTAFNDTVCYMLMNETHLHTYLTALGFKVNYKLDKKETVKINKPDTEGPVQDAKASVTNWKTLSYLLTGIIGLVALITGIVFLFFIRRRWASKAYGNLQARQVVDAEIGNEYVVFRRLQSSYDVEEDISALLPRPSVRGCRVVDVNVRKYSRYHRKRLYKPQRRLLAEGVDDVFESEDSGGSRSLRLQTIPEKSDSDIDDVSLNEKSNSEQTKYDKDKSDDSCSDVTYANIDLNAQKNSHINITDFSNDNEELGPDETMNNEDHGQTKNSGNSFDLNTAFM